MRSCYELREAPYFLARIVVFYLREAFEGFAPPRLTIKGITGVEYC